ncbi:MAG: MBL fold metallo-hydrolase [Alphaproteobacteria bacterium]|nr:MBL fold metallo-hydrolase [Alphaproteobacteria bacterium]
MTKAFASRGDMTEKKIAFTRISPHCWAYEAESDPTSGVIVGEDAVMVLDTRATPVAARDLIARVRKRTKAPLKYVVLTHYHAVRVMGASAYKAPYVVASQGTYDLIKERGRQDFASEVWRFPRLFQAVESVPGLTWPNLVFEGRLTLWLGKTEVQLMHLGAGHTKGDTVAWLPKERVLFAGDLVENGATPYAGDAHLGQWVQTLDRLKALEPRVLVPGRGPALTSPKACLAAIASTQGFVQTLLDTARRGVSAGQNLKQLFDSCRKVLEPDYGHWGIFEHCLPFDVSRAYDEASGIDHPRIWTKARDVEMWKALQG